MMRFEKRWIGGLLIAQDGFSGREVPRYEGRCSDQSGGIASYYYSYIGETRVDLETRRIESIICLYNQFIRGELMQGCSEKGRKVIGELG